MTNAKTYKSTVLIIDSPNDAEAWADHHGDLYRCPVYLLPEASGGFSVIAGNLRGVASQGETEAEALANIGEALAAAIITYKEGGEGIPWADPPRDPEPGAVPRWVFVDVR